LQKIKKKLSKVIHEKGCFSRYIIYPSTLEISDESKNPEKIQQ
jgi:hypothetical protein